MPESPDLPPLLLPLLEWVAISTEYLPEYFYRIFAGVFSQNISQSMSTLEYFPAYFYRIFAVVFSLSISLRNILKIFPWQYFHIYRNVRESNKSFPLFSSSWTGKPIRRNKISEIDDTQSMVDNQGRTFNLITMEYLI